MKTLRFSRIFAAAMVAAVSLVAGEALAAANQQVTTTDQKMFGDWGVRCYTISSPSPCEMYEILASKQTKQRLVSMSIAYVPSRNQHVIQIVVPLDISIANGLVVGAGDYTSPPLPYHRCDENGCYVEMIAPEDLIGALGKSTKAQIDIVAVNGRKFNLPFSLHGFGDAHSAMMDLAKQKATTEPAATPAANAPAASSGN